MTQQPQSHARVAAQNHQQRSPPLSHDVAFLYSSTGSHCCFSVPHFALLDLPVLSCGWSVQGDTHHNIHRRLGMPLKVKYPFALPRFLPAQHTVKQGAGQAAQIHQQGARADLG